MKKKHADLTSYSAVFLSLYHRHCQPGAWLAIPVNATKCGEDAEGSYADCCTNRVTSVGESSVTAPHSLEKTRCGEQILQPVATT